MLVKEAYSYTKLFDFLGDLERQRRELERLKDGLSKNDKPFSTKRRKVEK